MIELWILGGVVLWLGLLTLVVALCVAAGRADGHRPDRRAGADEAGVSEHVPRFVRPRETRPLTRR